MLLEKLHMRGFKTFADRTELEFGPGITAIVGPNGVGKSNISDAILWALGEQSYKALRTEGSRDVIFIGSEERRPLGMAEATLTLDNSDGALPCDYSEVAISRRLFRNGDSEYLLNRNKVRLKDINELLIDTGLASGAYAVVGQGEIDAIISIRAEDRRELLEQVAGVGKYRLRRSETERRLDQTQANITRVEDILYELSSQRQELEEQAEVAREYQGLSGRLRELELHLLADDYQRHTSKRQQATTELTVAKADVQGIRNQISEIETEYEQTNFQVTKLGDELDSRREQARVVEREVSRRQSTEAVAEERLKTIRQRCNQLQTELDQAQQHCQQLEEHQHTLEADQREYQQLVERQRVQVEELETAYQQQEEQYQQATHQREDMRQQRTELAGQIATLENETTTLAGLEEELQQRIERLTGQREQVEQRRQQSQQTLSEDRKRIEVLRAQAEETQQQLRQEREEHHQQIRLLREHRQKRDLLAEAVAAVESRQHVLQELQEAHEGYDEGPRALLQASKQGELAGIRGLVVDFLQVPRRLEAAVEAALHDRLQWVLVETEQDVRQCLEYLEEHQAGRATLLATSPPPTQLAGRTPVAVGRSSGVLGTAASLLKYPRQLAHVFELLLADTVIVEDLDTAYRIRPRLTGATRLVTLRGEVIGPAGQVTGGSVNRAATMTFNRHHELEQIDRQLGELRTYLAQMWHKEEELEAHQQQEAEWVQERSEELTAAEKQISQVEGEITHIADRLRAAAAASDDIEEETQQVKERLQAVSSRAAEAERVHRGLGHEVEELEGKFNKLQSQQPMRQQLETRQEELTAAKVQLAELREKDRSATAMLNQTQRELARVEQQIEHAQGQLVQLQEEQSELTETLQSQDGQTEDLEQQAADLREQTAQTRNQLAKLREATSDLEVARRHLEQLREEKTEEVHRLDLAMAREDSQLEQTIEQLQDIYELTPDQARQQQPSDFSRQATSRQANQLREQIRALGYVNVGAIQQCERLKQREDFLSGQLDDLHQAREDLRQIIAEIEEVAEKLFRESFDQVAEAFEELFQRLFGGGTTRLELTDPENPLAGGVEVIVQLAGRRQQNLLLLSGGEKALTALALLLAMIKVRPSPFCVLDEIDATLDAPNTEKFTAVLRDFAQYSQFIVITHNPTTMEAADVLYGVTMQEPGVSQVISVELAEAQREAEQRAARAEVAGQEVAAAQAPAD